MIKKLSVLTVIAIFGISAVGCTSNEQRVAGYGGSGAVLGALTGAAVSGRGHRGRNAVRGAAIGAVAGTLLGVAQTRNGVQYCSYRDGYGRIYEAPCN